MDNIERWYAVVGVLEEFDKTLTVLEKILPRYFKDVVKLFDERMRGKGKLAPAKNGRSKLVRLKRWTSGFNKNPHEEVTNKTKQILRSKLRIEYDLYNFIIQHLGRQAHM